MIASLLGGYRFVLRLAWLCRRRLAVTYYHIKDAFMWLVFPSKTGLILLERICPLGKVSETSSFEDDPDSAARYREHVYAHGDIVRPLYKKGDRKFRRILFVPLALLLLYVSLHTSVVQVHYEPHPHNIVVWEERTPLQWWFRLPGSHRYITEVSGHVIQHGPLRNGDPHGVWLGWTLDARSGQIVYDRGRSPLYKIDYRGKFVKTKDGWLNFKYRVMGIPAAMFEGYDPQPLIGDFAGGWRIPVFANFFLSFLRL